MMEIERLSRIFDAVDKAFEGHDATMAERMDVMARMMGCMLSMDDAPEPARELAELCRVVIRYVSMIREQDISRTLQ